MRGENRLPASTGGAEVTGACGKNRPMNLGRQREVKSRSGKFRKKKTENKKPEQNKTEPGRFAEGPRQPRLILPASAVSEQETRKKFNASQGAQTNLQRLARNSIKLFKGPQETRKKPSNKLARNSKKRFKTLQETRREKSFQNRATNSADLLAATFSSVSHREAGNFPSANFISPAKLYFSSSPRRNS